jgi:hypothetical protein
LKTSDAGHQIKKRRFEMALSSMVIELTLTGVGGQGRLQGNEVSGMERNQDSSPLCESEFITDT